MAAGRCALSFCWTRQDVDGNGMSPVIVATMIKSSSSGLTLARSIARNPAWAAKSDVNSSLPASRRSLIPVRAVIHSSVVSTIFSRSALVKIFAGTYDPTPEIEHVRPWKLNLARGFVNFPAAEVLMLPRVRGLAIRGPQGVHWHALPPGRSVD